MVTFFFGRFHLAITLRPLGVDYYRSPACWALGATLERWS